MIVVFFILLIIYLRRVEFGIFIYILKVKKCRCYVVKGFLIGIKLGNEMIGKISKFLDWGFFF